MSRWAGGCCRSICSEEGVPPERMKLSKGGGDPKSVNIERTYFLNGPLRKLLTKGTPFSMLNKSWHTCGHSHAQLKELIRL